MIIEPAKLTDLPEIFQLIQQVGKEKEKDDTFAYSTDINIYERIIRNNYCLVARDNGRIVASFLTFSENEDIEGVYSAFDISKMEQTIILETCQVLPEYRGQHLQYKMGEKILSDCSNYKYAICTVSPYNIPSYKTFLKLGFTIYADTILYGKQRLLMMKELSA